MTGAGAIRRSDAVLVASIAAVGQLEVWVPGFVTAEVVGPRAANAAAYLLATLMLLWRRQRPVPVLAAVFAITSIQYLLLGASQGLGSFLPPLVAVYATGRHADASSAVTAYSLALLGTAVHDLRDPNFEFSGAAVTFWVILAAAWPLGRAFRLREVQAEELRHRARRLEVDREQEAAAAAAAERGRIAGELHDVVGHGLTVVTLQVVAALGSLDKDDRLSARSRLLTAERTLRDTLSEMRRLVGLLDEDTEASGATPASLTNVKHLVEDLRRAGLTVDLVIDPAPTGLPPGLDQAAYRIVQEALTNVLRHAEGAGATVNIRANEATLELEIVDDGPGCRPDAPSGRGIAGMRQRAALYGGWLATGPGEAGGYRVHARLPLAEAAP